MAIRKNVGQGMPEWLDGSTAELVREPTSDLAAAINEELETVLPGMVYEISSRTDLVPHPTIPGLYRVGTSGRITPGPISGLYTFKEHNRG